MLSTLVGCYRPCLRTLLPLARRSAIASVALFSIFSICQGVLRLITSQRTQANKELHCQFAQLVATVHDNLMAERNLRKVTTELEQQRQAHLRALDQIARLNHSQKCRQVLSLVFDFNRIQRLAHRRESAALKIQYAVSKWLRKRRLFATTLQSVCRRKLVWRQLEDIRDELRRRIAVTKAIDRRAYRKWVFQTTSSTRHLYKKIQAVCRTFLAKRTLRASYPPNIGSFRLFVHYGALYREPKKVLSPLAKAFNPKIVATNSKGKEITLRAPNKLESKPAPCDPRFSLVCPEASDILQELDRDLSAPHQGLRSITTLGSSNADLIVKHLKGGRFPKVFCFYKQKLVARQDYVEEHIVAALQQPLAARSLGSRLGPIVLLIDNPDHLPMRVKGVNIRLSFGPKPIEGLIYSTRPVQNSASVETWELAKFKSDAALNLAPYLVLTKRCCDIICLKRQAAKANSVPPAITAPAPVVSLATIMEVEGISKEVDDCLLQEYPAPLQIATSSSVTTDHLAIYDAPNEVWGLLEGTTPQRSPVSETANLESDWLEWLRAQSGQ